jgi:RNA polymerase sigma factor (sigma-70 family)
MPTRPDHLLRCVRRAASRLSPEPADSALLGRFLTGRDQAAFAALVARHGPMVLRVCQRVLGNRHDAEDAFQATFLVLARKAASVRPAGALAAWLHGVAYRVALGARAGARRRTREGPPPDLALSDRRPDPLAELTAREALRILEEEVQRLPQAYRLPLVLCCLHGVSQEEAARQLGWTPGSVRGRLERGRRLLHRRLAGRGLELAAALALVEVSRTMADGPAGSLVASTVGAAVAFASAGGAGARVIAAEVVSLAEGALKPTALGPMKYGLVLLLIAGAVSIGLAARATQAPAEEPPQARPATDPGQAAAAVEQAGPPNQKDQARTDRYGDPLPEGAVARLGTVRFRHPDWVRGLAFTPDGKTLASACSDGTVRLWDPTTGRERRCFRVERNPVPGRGEAAVLGVVISPDGKELMALENFGTAYVWDLVTGRELHSLKGSSGFGLALSPDGKTLVVGRGGDTAQRQLTLWDLAAGKPVRELGAATRPTAALALSPDGKLLATGDSAPVGEFRPGVDSGASAVRLWDAVAGRKLHEMEGHTGGVTAVAFSPDGRALVSASHDATLRFWDLPTGKPVRTVPVADETTPRGPPDDNVRGVHYGGVLAVAYSPDGRLLASGSEDGTVRLWDAAAGRELHALRGHGREVASVAFSPDGKVLASGSLDNTIRLWDPANGKPLQTWEGQDGPVTNLAVSPDGRLAAAAGSDRTIRLWSLTTGRRLHVLRGHTGSRYYQVAFTPDGSAVVSGSADRTARVWDAATGREVGRLADRPGYVVYVAPLAGRNTLLTAGPGRALRVWDWASGQELRQIAGAGGSRGLQTSSDGSIVAASDDKAAYLLDPATGKELRRFEAPSPYIALSPDGRTLAVHGFKEKQIHFRSVATGEEVATPIDYDWGPWYAGVARYVFSPDGRLLARVGDYRTIVLWEVLTGKVRRQFRGHQARIMPLAFAPDGKTLLSGSDDTTVLVWDVARRQEQRPGRLSDAELQGAWQALADEDAEKADRAVFTLAATAAQSVPFLERHLRPARVAGPERLARLIADLDSDEFAVRERATRELAGLGEQAEPVLREALKKSPSPEVRRRMQDLLGRLRGVPPAPDLLRSLRAVEVFEHVGTPQARELLAALARGAPEARLTQEAKASLERLARRRSP